MNVLKTRTSLFLRDAEEREQKMEGKVGGLRCRQYLYFVLEKPCVFYRVYDIVLKRHFFDFI